MNPFALPLCKSELVRFWSRVKRKSSCWLWTANVNHRGYGLFGLRRDCNGERKTVTAVAHRLIFCVSYGLTDISAKDFVCHRCDVRNCVRPDHLFLGTHESNMKDMALKNRAHRPIGNLHHNKVINQDIALQIWEQYHKECITQKQLAKNLDVNPAIVASVIKKQTWRHVTEKSLVKPRKIKTAPSSYYYGETCWNAKMNAHQVAEIWNTYHTSIISLDDVAKRFCVPISSVKGIVNGRVWRRVTGELCKPRPRYVKVVSGRVRCVPKSVLAQFHAWKDSIQ